MDKKISRRSFQLKETRKMIQVIGDSELITVLLRSVLLFKGACTYITSPTRLDIENAFACNKSVIAPEFLTPIIFETPFVVRISQHPADDGIPTIEYTAEINHLVNKFLKLLSTVGIDIGDHISNTSANYATSSNCSYCTGLLNPKVKSNPSKQIIYESDNFIVVPTLGQFTLGYFLIIPKNHFLSLGEIWNNNKNLIDEFYAVLEDTKYILCNAFGAKNLLVFENGTGNDACNISATSIVHCHIHVVSTELIFSEVQEISGFNFEILENVENLSTDSSYLLIQTENSKWAICYTNKEEKKVYIPRKYMRQLIAEYDSYENTLGCTDCWDWQKHGYEENMAKAYKIAVDFIRNHYPELPDRICFRTKHLFV